jgi:hypothetical protein
MPIPQALLDVFDAALSSLLDPHPIQFRAADESGVAAIRAVCRRDSGTRVNMRRPLNRNAFLCGVLDMTEREAVEYLFVGFGRRHGSTTRVEAVAHTSGSADRVLIPASLWKAVEDWLADGSRHEVLLVHNHPRNILNVLFDNMPLASGTDRDTWLRAVLHGKTIRCFLVENGFVREFRTPGRWDSSRSGCAIAKWPKNGSRSRRRRGSRRKVGADELYGPS